MIMSISAALELEVVAVVTVATQSKVLLVHIPP